MKKTLLALILIPTLVFAETATPPKFDFCTVYAETARLIMKSHQVGVPMSRAMENMEGSPMGRERVIAAYSYPRYSTPAMQTRAMEEFRDLAYLGCVKGGAVK